MNNSTLDPELHMPGLDSSVRELRATRPRLRRGLRFTFQDYSGGRYALIEDRLHSRFHRVGLPEYVFLTFLDGHRTIAEAFARASLVAGPEAITEHEALYLTHWLVHNDLVDFETTTNEIAVQKEDQVRKSKALELVNFMFLRVPLGSPDRLFRWGNNMFGWLCHPFFWIPWLAVVLTACALIIYNWHRFTLMAGGVFSSADWWVMLVIWAGLKVVHECGHGLVCKYYGCRVREAGLSFMLFMPITYVDATASWALPSKWQRMHVSFGGLWVELFIASIAAIYWSQTSDGFYNTLAYKLITVAGVTTVLFNLNPLMRFDGYFLLADWLEMPNLYGRAQATMGRFGSRYLLGQEVQEPTGVPRWEQTILFVYGFAAFFWRILTMLMIVIGASALWKGGGLMLGILSAIIWLGPGLYQTITALASDEGVGAASHMRLLFRLGFVVAIVAMVCFIPTYPRVSAPAVVQVKDMVVLRAECPGFINSIKVKEGDVVKQGQLLVEVLNREEASEVKVLDLKLQYQEKKTSLAQDEKKPETGSVDIASVQAEQTTLDGMRKQYAEKAKRLASLNIVAPCDGIVLTWKLPQRIGTFLQPGDEVLRLGMLPARELKLAIPDASVDAFRARINQRLEVLLPGRVETEAVLKRVTSRGTRDVTNPELTSLAKGPLPVAHRKQDSTRRKDDNRDPYAGYELVEPTFEGVAEFVGAPPESVRTGQVARTRFRISEPIPLWKVAYGYVEDIVAWLFNRANQRSSSEH